MTGVIRTIGLVCIGLSLAACTPSSKALDENAPTLIPEIEAAALAGGKPDTFYGRRVVHLELPGGRSCSATVIHQRLLLTAAHCAYNISPADIQVRSEFISGGVLDVRLHPLFVMEEERNGYDLAMLYTDFDMLEAASPLEIVDLADIGWQKHERRFYELVGAGSRASIPNFDLSHGEVTGGIFRAKDEVYRDSSWRGIKDYFSNEPERTGEFVVLERASVDENSSGRACSGDAGGAFWERTTEDQVILVGILVRTLVLSYDGIKICGSRVEFIPVGLYREWIEQSANELLQPTN